jgi:hypothetical protein
MARATTAATRVEATEVRSHALRLYVLSITLLVFFVLWAVIAARPWAATPTGERPALKALAARERHLRHEARVVEKAVRRRWVSYRRRLHAREAQIRALEQRHAAELAAASAAMSTASYSATPASRVVTLPPQVRVVTLPPAGASTSSGSSHP